MSAMKIENVINDIKRINRMSEIKPEDYAEVGGWAEVVVRDVGDKLKPTQLRKIFHHLKHLQREFQKSAFNRAKVATMIPLLAYAKGRGHIPDEFHELLLLCFSPEKCNSVEDFRSAVSFMEAIMAFHKFYNPKQ